MLPFVNNPLGTLQYRRLQYIESTGTQYINTGVKPDFANGDSVEISFYRPVYSAGDRVFFGSRRAPALDSLYMVSYAVVTGDSSSYTSVTVPNTPGDCIFQCNDQQIRVNGTDYNMPKRVTCSFSIYLFAMNTSGTVFGQFADMRLYDWKYWRNGVLAQRLIPVLDKSGVPCMYDTVTHTLKYNAGTGAFNYA